MADEQKPVADAFGVERAPDTGQPVVPEPVAPAAAAEGADKGKEGADKTKVAPPAADDLEKSPIVLGLRKEISDLNESLKKETGDKSAMGKNLSKLRERLDKIEKGDKTDAAEPVFKKEEIKRVKDYSKEEQDAFTEAEKSLIESNADMKERINGMVATAAQKVADDAAAAGEKSQAEKEADETKTRIEGVVKPLALGLAGNDAGLANKIIENFNMFAGNDALDDKALKERVEAAARMIPEFKPAKEQKSPAGSAVAEGTAKDDPHGVTPIIEQARAQQGGKGFTL